jgi:hypothetical protein
MGNTNTIKGRCTSQFASMDTITGSLQKRFDEVARFKGGSIGTRMVKKLAS